METRKLAVANWTPDIPKEEFVSENRRDARTFRRRFKEDRHGRLSDKCRKGCGSHACGWYLKGGQEKEARVSVLTFVRSDVGSMRDM